MREIALDASGWAKILDFFNALLPKLGAPEGTSLSVDGLIDSMIWGGMNAFDPPYVVKVYNTRNMPDNLRDDVLLIKKYLAEGREDFRALEERDVEVSLEIVS